MPLHLLKIIMCAVFVIPAAANAQATLGGDWRADVDDWAQRLIAAELVPGLGVAIIQGDWILYDRGYGMADAQTGRRVTPDTWFYVASSTKALTATAGALQAHRGELELDAPVIRYLPQLGGSAWDQQGVTIADLLAMRHGITDGGPVVVRTAFTGQFTRDKLLELLKGYTPTDQGKVFDYGNLGYNVLGLVLSRGTGTWKEAIQAEVIEPLGMMGTSAWLSRVPPGQLAMPHDLQGRIPLAKADANLHAAGGHLTTPRSLARFVAAHISGGVVEGERLLPAEPLRLTHQAHASQDRQFGDYHRTGWGYGWDIGDYEGKTLIHRFGSFSGYRSHMSFMPEHGIGVVVLANAGGPAADLMANYVYDRLLGKPGLQDRYDEKLEAINQQLAQARQGIAAHLEERRARLAPLPHPLEAYAGIYENDALGTMEWRVVAGGLEMRAGVAHSRAEVYDANQNALRIEVGGSGGVAQFVFEDGNATAIRYADQEFRRVAPTLR